MPSHLDSPFPSRKRKYPFKTIDRDAVKFRLPFAMVLAGPQSSGKTTLLLKLIRHFRQLFRPLPAEILYCYGEYNASIPELQELGVRVHMGVPTDEMLAKRKKPLLLIMDDLMLHVDKKYLDLLVTVKVHHRNIGVIFVAQNLFEKNIKTARDNAQYIILMNAPSSIRQIRDIGASLFPSKSKIFMEIYKEATQKNYGYLLIDLHAGTDSDMRLRTDIFPDEYTKVFVP